MDTRSRLELANDNAAGFWLIQAGVHGWESVRAPMFTAVRCEGEAEVHRLVVTRPYAEPAALKQELLGVLRQWRTARLCLEDPYGLLDLRPHGCEASLGQAVMVREPGGGTAADGPGAAASPRGRRGEPAGRLTVVGALQPEELAAVERVIVDGFPMPARLPVVRGAMLPPGLLDAPGYRAWLARVDGCPAGACVSYDDGTAVGVYSVATLPEHRSRGIGRALVAAALAAHPDRVATLTSTLLGEPLYRRLGFTEHGVARWWRYPATPSSMTV
ncbi:GNAT family N-acetyltransferase [Kitasatospora sp. DSM 101779]|uniref:GNAT family N-acetyltransferase n=1 Tax=Kitasatospora sp. DSM 101779 TaxID=2853165 RepID=UPI0021D91F9B|nr:GNAT family N-acetyltransferase [Kitasatospora sp. DSM 101779]MCU7824675.1 GNAT family N-acetyltransferase [Kitasatospora sp. DSM 101779]